MKDFYGYQVSDRGRVRRGHTVIKQTRGRGGYYVVRLCNRWGSINYPVHRLVAAAFLPYSDKGIRHKDGNKANNRADNLEEAGKMTKEEQETSITWDKSTSIMRIYTADPALMRRLNGLQSYKLIKEHRQGGKVTAAEYEAEKRLLTLRSKAPASTMSEEQRAAARERLRKYHKQEKAI